MVECQVRPRGERVDAEQEQQGAQGEPTVLLQTIHHAFQEDGEAQRLRGLPKGGPSEGQDARGREQQPARDQDPLLGVPWTSPWAELARKRHATTDSRSYTERTGTPRSLQLGCVFTCAHSARD